MLLCSQGPASSSCNLCSGMVLHACMGPMLIYGSVIIVLKFLILIEQSSLAFCLRSCTLRITTGHLNVACHICFLEQWQNLSTGVTALWCSIETLYRIQTLYRDQLQMLVGSPIVRVISVEKVNSIFPESAVELLSILAVLMNAQTSKNIAINLQ